MKEKIYVALDIGETSIKAVAMNEYNSKRLERLHMVSQSTVDYYDERIAVVFEQLKAEEAKAAEYQRKNRLAGVEAELEALVEYSVESKSEIHQANHKLAYYENVLNLLHNRLNDDVLIPQMESLGDSTIKAYNNAI